MATEPTMLRCKCIFYFILPTDFLVIEVDPPWDSRYAHLGDKWKAWSTEDYQTCAGIIAHLCAHRSCVIALKGLCAVPFLHIVSGSQDSLRIAKPCFQAYERQQVALPSSD